MTIWREMDSPLGRLSIGSDGTAVTALRFGAAGGPEEAHPLLERCIRELEEYFQGERRNFTLPLAPGGTPFQQTVWSALLTIPYGEVRSYGQIAAQIGNPKAARAVGMANHNNPIPILIPCHRVIGAGGTLVGYAGGLEIKRQLLALEGIGPDGK